MNTPQLELQEVSKSYGPGKPTISHLSLKVREGEFLVLVGPSGCGKSTLLRMISGLESVSSGRILIEGKDVTRVAPGDRGIAMVFQDYALYPHMSVRENLSFGLKIKKLSPNEIQARMNETAQMLKLEGLLDRKPAQLSGGQRQRVAIGRALVKRPKLFLMDEPLSNLDAQLRAQTRVELASLHRKLASTTVYVTHDQTEAMTLADRIVVLKEGRIQQVGSPLDLYHHPANRFVASFIGTPGMNFLEGFSIPQIPLRGQAILGIRPEGIKVDPGSGDFRAKLMLIEPHGYESHLFFESHQQRLIVRAPALKYELGAEYWLTLDRGAVHWFAPDAEGTHLDGDLKSA